MWCGQWACVAIPPFFGFACILSVSIGSASATSWRLIKLHRYDAMHVHVIITRYMHVAMARRGTVDRTKSRISGWLLLGMGARVCSIIIEINQKRGGKKDTRYFDASYMHPSLLKFFGKEH